jgi:hypothetical protein
VEAPAKVLEWRADPLRFVLDVFGPGYEKETGKSLKDEVEEWQGEGLSYLVEHEPHDWCDGLPAKGIALRGAKGVGKGAWDAWAIWWLEYCWSFANIAAMSVSADNLRDNLWKELAKWYGRAPVLQDAFELRGERIVPRGATRDMEDRWFCSARSFPQKPDKAAQAAVVQGLHADHVAVFIDEGGSVPPGVLHAAEGIHANPVHSLVVVSGNCDSMEGALYDASVKRAHRYHVIKVTGDPDDPKCSKRIDKEHNRQLIQDHGRSDTIVLINVLAEFPLQGITKLLGEADLKNSLARKIAQRDHEQDVKVACLDVARHGIDSSVYTLRQGVFLHPQRKVRIPNTMRLAQWCAEQIDADKPDAMIVLVTGIGWGVADKLRELGYGSMLIEIDEGVDARDPEFGNIRAEMWWNAAQWVKERGVIVDDAELKADLLAPGWRTKFYKGKSRILIDPADVLRQALGRSPDKGTSFVGTFAAHVAPRHLRQAQRQQYVETDFDPWKVLRGE